MAFGIFSFRTVVIWWSFHCSLIAIIGAIFLVYLCSTIVTTLRE
jgi:hypothetical protein